MSRTRIAGAIAALAMLAAPAVASAHRGHDDNGRHHGRHHHAKKAHVKDLPAGTVTSFTAGELTITLANNKTYTATVTDKTVIKCDTAAPQTPAPATARTSRHGDDDPAGDDRGDDQGDDHVQGGAVQKDDQDDDHGNGDDNGNGRCTAADLVAGTKVTDADLSLSNGGVWKKVELLK
jgi:hypothetical protein